MPTTTKIYTVCLSFSATLHVEADNLEDAKEAAIAAEEDWGNQLAHSTPEVTWAELDD